MVGGYTQPQGVQVGFGALLLSYFEKGEFRFAGKVGTGLNEVLLRKLLKQFQKIRVKDCPFPALPGKRAGKYGSGVTKAAMKKCVRLKPSVVCQVKFTECTKDGKLRHPVFLGIRVDKNAKQIVGEVPS